MITLKQLNYALAVAKTRHFKKAAEVCHVSQSALSTGVAELENQLGCQLFERDNKQVLVTPIGERLLEQAQTIRLQVDDLMLTAKAHKDPLAMPMSLGVIPTIGPYLLPRVLAELQSQYPQLQLTLEEGQSATLLERVRDGLLDCAVLALPYDTQGLHCFEFWEENFVVLSHASHPLANQAQVSSKQLSEHTLLLLQDGHCLKDHALAACHLVEQAPQHSLAATSLATLVELVAGDFGVTLIPEMSLPALQRQAPGLSAIPLDEPGPHRKLAFICRLNYAGVDNIQRLIKLFTGQLNQGVSCVA
ncbi:hydrogen peroxide-inducible genes activator [Paraferrimonas sedimenticola]|uniref:Transcriptional regulator n=1 Tax=Paraferrimonas sedimenticola TaxID=375674 RepID=A0AA37VT43_9GAMM|nr:hydrogen peroxide-inducible genes activator [Paraferrimonas sedimenticola]GLP95051.1 transcriptional regulator [Paraferrimonas sedimenticola]